MSSHSEEILVARASAVQAPRNARRWHTAVFSQRCGANHPPPPRCSSPPRTPRSRRCGRGSAARATSTERAVGTPLVNPPSTSTVCTIAGTDSGLRIFNRLNRLKVIHHNRYLLDLRMRIRMHAHSCSGPCSTRFRIQKSDFPPSFFPTCIHVRDRGLKHRLGLGLLAP